MLAAARNAKPSRILVADDSTFMRRLLTQALRDAGFEVVGEAADGDEALSLYRELRPDAMTLDLAMPGMDGIGVLRALRGERSSLPVVVVSAFSPAHGARAVDALAEGAFDLVAKPAFGEPLETFVSALREKVTAAASSAAPKASPRRPGARPRAPRRTNAAAPAVARLRARRAPGRDQEGGVDRHLDRRPPRPGRADPGPAVAPGRRRHDRPAHARGLHRLAGPAPGPRRPAQRSSRRRAARR